MFSVRDDASVVALRSLKERAHEEVFHDPSVLLSFGSSEIVLFPDCYSHSKNLTNVGKGTYEGPKGLDQFSEKHRYFLNHGKHNFCVQELEVCLYPWMDLDILVQAVVWCTDVCCL